MTDLENWEKGVELSQALIRFADPYQLSKFRDAYSEGAILTYKLLMYADIFAKVELNEFEAFGFQTKPTVIAGPVKIPSHVFEPHPDVELAEQNTVSVSGFEYERIRVRPISNPQASESSPASTGLGKIGRPPTYGKAKKVLNVLFQIESNRSKSAAKLHKDFDTEFQKQFPQKDWDTSTPSVRKLQDHLKQYRQELAETGNNDFAI
ncbi:MAG: hypothetical protein WAT93_04420 [Pontixanthobacter sp.]